MNDYIAKPVDERLLYTKIIGLVNKPVFALTTLDDSKENTTTKKIKCIDLGYLTKRTKSDPKLMSEMISLYLEQTPPLIKTMKQSLQDKDWGLLYGAAHKMIPSFSIMGISLDFEEMAKKVQHYASTQEETGKINDFVLQLENVCEQACEELTEELHKITLTQTP
jgi:HPt (histidine-containing phosphotransfer) domain-containing protein